MFMKKKQLLREIPNKDSSCPAPNQEVEPEMTALGINLNQPLTDQLAKHCKVLKTHPWDDETYAASRPTTEDDGLRVHAPENMRPEYPAKGTDVSRNSVSPAPVSKWNNEMPQTNAENALERKQSRSDNSSSKALDTYSNSSSNLGGYSKTLNGMAPPSSSSSSSSGSVVKMQRRFDEVYRSNGKEFDDKRGSPSSAERSKRSSDKLKDQAAAAAASSVKSGRTPQPPPPICSTLLPGPLPDRTSSLPTLSGYPLCSLPLQLLPTLPNAAALSHPSLPQLLQMQQQQQHAAARLQQLHLLQQQQQQQPARMSTASLLSSYSLHAADNLLTHQLEMLWQQKYPNRAVPPGWMLYQYQDELLRDPRIPTHQKEGSGITRDKEDPGHERERMLREIVEKEKLDWERQERENAERERIEMERHQKEKKDRERWEQEKHDLERQEHLRALDRERREWDRHQQQQQQQEARRDQQQQQQRLQLEMHQRRELIVDESASSASDAVNQHFQESFLRLASQKIEGTRMEVANPSYAYMTGPRNIYRDRVKIERHQNPLCNKIDDDVKYGKMMYQSDAKLQDMTSIQRESGQHQSLLRQDTAQHEGSRRESAKHEGTNSANKPSTLGPAHFASPGQMKPEMLNFNLYGYQPPSQPPKDHLYNSPQGRLPSHALKEESSPKAETDAASKYERHDSFATLKNGSVEGKHDTKQTSVIMEPRCVTARDPCDMYHHGSITLGTAGSGLHRGQTDGQPSFGNGVRLSNSVTGNLGSVSQAGSKLMLGSPASGSVVKDLKQGRNVTNSPRPLPAVSTAMYNMEAGPRDAFAPWLAGSKEQYEQWRDMAIGVIPQKGGPNLGTHSKLTGYPGQNIPPSGHLTSSVIPGHHLVSLPTCSLIQQGLVPNPLYISSVISSTGATGALALPTSSALHGSGQGLHLAIGSEDGSKSLEDLSSSMKRRPKKEPNNATMKKKSRMESELVSRFAIPKTSSATPTVHGDSMMSGSHQNLQQQQQQPAYLDSFKSFVDHAVQNAFLQDRDIEVDQPSPVREKMRQLLDSEPKPGDDAIHGLVVATPNAAPVATVPKTPEPDRPIPARPPFSDVETARPSASTTPNDPVECSPPVRPADPVPPPLVLSQPPPAPAPSPGGASLSSLSSLTENVNRGRGGCLDTDSDTLSAHSPTTTAPSSSATGSSGTPLPPSLGGINLSIHHKFHRKAWLHHYLNEDKKNSSECGDEMPSCGAKPVVPPGEKMDGSGGVRGCYINLSYIPKETQSQVKVSASKEFNHMKQQQLEDLDDVDSEGTRSTDGHSNKRTRNKKPAGSTKRVKPSDPESPPMPDLVQEKQLENTENISDQSQEEDDNMDAQSSSSSKVLSSEKSNELESLSSQTDCETKMAARLHESKEKGKVKGSPSTILESKPLNPLSEAKRKKSKEAFLQDGACSDVTPKLVKCRECKMTRTQRNKNLPNIFCRFYAFRKLRYSAKGFLTVAGFSKPTDADADDIQLWMPLCSRSDPPPPLTICQAKYILSNIKDSFLTLFDLENEAASMAPFQAKVAWKRPIQGVREMCDVCDATLFDIHWACQKCGFAVCADCYRSHSATSGATPVADENRWLTCSANRQEHEPETLMITQIVPSDVRMVVGRMLREVAVKWGIQSMLRCDQGSEMYSLTRKNGIYGPNNLSSSKTFLNGTKLDERNATKGRLGNRKKLNSSVMGVPLLLPVKTGQVEPGDKKENAEPAGVTTSDPDGTGRSDESKVESGSEDEMMTRSMKHKASSTGTNGDCASADEAKDCEALEEDDASHLWLDDGRLLQLLDSTNRNNVRLFQLGWQHGIPVLISNCDKQTRPELWSPCSFAKEFGHVKVDLVDCSTGVVLKSQPMDKFWNGFRHSNAPRSKQGGGTASSILRLKDWPTVEDWAGPLAARCQDLNRLLPVADYSHPSGTFNLISHLPEFFVRPDLAMRIHASYSSCAQHRVPFSKLRLDLADSVNIMMYVEAATAEDNQNATRALKEAGYNARAKSAYKTSSKVGAVWHIFRPQDADRIREFLKKVDTGNSSHRTVDQVTDPLSDNSSYLDKALRARLLNECGIQSTVVVQCLGDALFLPAMTPYQVKVIHSCVMVSKEFLSPESVRSCFARMQQARQHSSTDCVSNLDDQLQIKNIIYHSVKDSIAVLQDNDP